MSCDDIAGLTPAQVCEKYEPRVRMWAHRTSAFDRYLPKADRMQEGFIGLLDAIPRFDPTRGVKFSTYADYWIRMRIMEAVHWKSSIIRVPRWALRAGVRWPTVASLSTPIGPEDSGTLYDCVRAPEDSSVEDADEVAKVPALLHCLDERERRCLWERVALGITLRRVAEPLGICGERVRQLVTQAIGRVRAHERKRTGRTAHRRWAFRPASSGA